jgi:sugar phosphate isomerase/epimerase
MMSAGKWAAPEPEEAIRVLRENGYDGVEWMLGHHFRSPRELESIVKETRASGLEVSNIMCWEDYVSSEKKVREKRVGEILKYVEAAGRLSVPVVNTFTGPMTWNPDHEELGRDISEGRAWSLVVDSFSQIVEAAEKNNVTVTLEAVFGMIVRDYYTMKEFLGYFDSERLSVNLDPSHLALYGNDPAWAVSKFGRKIRHVHVKDVIGSPGNFGKDFTFPFLGEGAVDWKRFFQALNEAGYSGFLSLEFENDAYLNNVCDGDWKIAAKESKSRLAKLMKKA